jgi:hypothetical protein
LTRDCLPSPVARSASIKSASNRKVTFFFGCSFVGRPRGRLANAACSAIRAACSAGNASAKGMDAAKSDAVHSGLSSSGVSARL